MIKVVQKTRLHASRRSNNEGQAGSFIVNSNNAPTNTNANIGSQLSFFKTNKFFVGRTNKVKNKFFKWLWYRKGRRVRKKQIIMKRVGNLWDKISSLDNICLADIRARKNKEKSYGVLKHDENRDENLIKLHRLLKAGKFKTSPYNIFTIKEKKTRIIYQLPYYPDRIVHHAIMNVLEEIFVSVFTADTYSCIKGRGTHSCMRAVRDALKQDPENTVYCLKFDIKQFYPSVDHSILKSLLRKKLKDKKLLSALDEIIDSAPGVPIGNYLSQYFANYYLAYFDHWVKEKLNVKYYFRYADDIVILHKNKSDLHRKLAAIRKYLYTNLKLEVKENYQVFPVKARGIDFVGYVIHHTHVLLRKSIKQDFARAVKMGKCQSSIASYKGWAIHCDSINLLKKLEV